MGLAGLHAGVQVCCNTTCSCIHTPAPLLSTNMAAAQAYNALLMAAVKGGETDLAVDVYHKMGTEGMARPRSIFATIVDVHVRNGKLQEALAVLGDMHDAGLAPEVHLYNLLLVACTKLVQPRSALDIYKR